MAMRNFWIVTKVDGRESDDATGPRNKLGGFTTHIYVKEAGGSVEKVKISGRVDTKGNLHVSVAVKGRKEINLEVEP